VHRHRNVVAEGVIVEHVDAEEECDADQPARDGDLVRLEEEGRAPAVELARQTDDGHEEKLNECEEGSCKTTSR
jgi:hypothetical protein